ncbi:hypothetical protein NP233_g219 [Leucocoprinus birnbaumii]|uniref:Uncharacterized protein n=1 Tax=Leucocoprinus birnbaumii TaxID=56174 RepID=A0AAD5W2R0_9AGAR|nr:hypothetical protein NP233_g219 [Leucocoprinus birnbaumii]
MADTANTPAPVLSFPAVLRNPGLKDRYAHLYGEASAGQERAASSPTRFKKLRRDQNEGKRWVRRKDNAQFVGNPHIVTATKKDYVLPTPSNKPTFPEPLPSYLPRTAKVPVATLPSRDPVSANAGRFSLSMKGMRKDLRRAGGRAEALVRIVEAEMTEWLQGGVMLRPDESNATGLANFQVKPGEGRTIESTGIIEVSRTPLQLVWSIADDAFARYVVHCCARYHEVVSFSKGDLDDRLTYLLRPNVQKPDYAAVNNLETPPVTDADYSSQLDTTDVDSDFVSDRDLIDSDVEETAANPRVQTTNPGGHLDSIRETSLPASPHLHPALREDDEWSVLSGDAGGFGDESSSEADADLLDSVASLSLQDTQAPAREPHDDLDTTLTQDAVSVIREVLEEGRESPLERLSHHQQPAHLPGRRWVRSTSSPSRSPVRSRRIVSARKKRQLASMRGAQRESHNRSFYDYLFN